MNLSTLLAERAALHPGRAALIETSNGRDRIVRFGELAARVASGAAMLHQLGLRRGHHVLVFQPVSIELYEFLLAAFHSGVRVMLADPSAGRPFLAKCCRSLAPDAFFGPPKAHALRWTIGELRRIPLAIRSGGYFPGTHAWKPAGQSKSVVDLPDEEPALITFTSGSTGEPKAAVRTHGFLLAQHAALSKALQFEDAEVDLITLPVFVLANLASGLTSVLAATDLANPGSPDVDAVRAQCSRHQVNRCAGSPAFFEAFLASPGGMPRFRKLFTGGAPVFPDLLRRLRVALPDGCIHSVFGSTEAEPIAHFSVEMANAQSDEITRLGGGLCAGAPVPEISLRIIRDHWGESLGPIDQATFDALQVPPQTAGEIVVSGNHVLPGYLNGIGDSETKIHVDSTIWHRTGDAGWIDAVGRLWLLGRCAEKLPAHPAPASLPADALQYPFAIEFALRERFPRRRMAALNWQGQRLLVCEASSGKDPAAAAIRNDAHAFGIETVRFLEKIPLDRRHNAKIDYPALKNLLAV